MSDIKALRAHLFATLAGLKDGSITPDKAKAINDTAQVVVNTAKVEVDFMRAANKVSGSGFFTETEATQNQGETVRTLRSGDQVTGSGVKHLDLVPGGSITTHRMR